MNAVYNDWWAKGFTCMNLFDFPLHNKRVMRSALMIAGLIDVDAFVLTL